MRAFECPSCRRVASPREYVDFGRSNGMSPKFGCEDCGTAFEVVPGFFTRRTRVVTPGYLEAHWQCLDPWDAKGAPGKVIEQWFERFDTNEVKPTRRGRAFGPPWRETLGL